VKRFELPIAVVPSDIDDNDHVNNVVYLRWINDVAVAHWEASATPAMRAASFWVATRHEIDYRREARLGDVLVARTWLGEVGSRRFERHTEIVRPSTGEVLARGRTLWTLIDRSSGRIARVPAEMVRAFEDYMQDDTPRDADASGDSSASMAS
jgi:acyl-CoA thioester hydrolase